MNVQPPPVAAEDQVGHPGQHRMVLKGHHEQRRRRVQHRVEGIKLGQGTVPAPARFKHPFEGFVVPLVLPVHR
ncbi:hypothetical protein SDC9_204310 [bioreactor metagenome]|uniref:Uncharacterized protein n=1 Tax=bioreactor metagenome TaxID=1076179 RepID=A0A645J0D0_9ZZZZ